MSGACPIPSRAERTAATWPSIMRRWDRPAGGQACRLDAAPMSRVAARRVRSLSTRPSCACSTPQCPWSVNSSRHRVGLTTSARPRPPPDRDRAMATLRMPPAVESRPTRRRPCAPAPRTASPRPVPPQPPRRPTARQQGRASAARRPASTRSPGRRSPRRRTAAAPAAGPRARSATIRRSAGAGIAGRRGRMTGPVIAPR